MATDRKADSSCSSRLWWWTSCRRLSRRAGCRPTPRVTSALAWLVGQDDCKSDTRQRLADVYFHFATVHTLLLATGRHFRQLRSKLAPWICAHTRVTDTFAAQDEYEIKSASSCSSVFFLSLSLFTRIFFSHFSCLPVLFIHLFFLNLVYQAQKRWTAASFYAVISRCMSCLVLRCRLKWYQSVFFSMCRLYRRLSRLAFFLCYTLETLFLFETCTSSLNRRIIREVKL